jgi:hypothetical protein
MAQRQSKIARGSKCREVFVKNFKTPPFAKFAKGARVGHALSSFEFSGGALFTFSVEGAVFSILNRRCPVVAKSKPAPFENPQRVRHPQRRTRHPALTRYSVIIQP